MMRQVFFVALCVCVALNCIPNVATAATVNVVYIDFASGETEDLRPCATGITGLDLGALGVYDVDFRRSAFDSEWYGGEFPFSFESEARQAADAINSAFNEFEPDGYIQAIYAYTPSYGGMTINSEYLVPVEVYDDTYNLVARSVYDTPAQTWARLEPPPQYLVAPDMETLYARFSPVPIPGALWLLGSGLIGLIGLKRKFKK
jgi:hypothetical protein